MSVNQFKRFSSSAGFTLIEVLVALIIVSIGLLGLAGLQATSVRFNQQAYLRSQAVQQAYDMADRIRANAVAAGEQEARRARDTLRVASAELALERAGEIVESRITSGDRDRLVDEFLRHLQDGPAGDAAGTSTRS